MSNLSGIDSKGFNSFFNVTSNSTNSGGGSFDFKSALSSLFSSSKELLHNYADPKTTLITIPGIGTLDKNTPAGQLAISVGFSDYENSLNTLLSKLEFMEKTFADKVFGILS